MTAARQKLPDRRNTETTDFEWKGQRWTVSIHPDQDGYAREIFVAPAIGGAKPGSDSHASVVLSAIMVSKLLQYGETLEGLIRALAAGDHETGISEAPLIMMAMVAALCLERQEASE